MTAVGIAVLALGLLGLSATVGDYMKFHLDLWSFISELFFPMGLAAGGIALLFGGGQTFFGGAQFTEYSDKNG